MPLSVPLSQASSASTGRKKLKMDLHSTEAYNYFQGDCLEYPDHRILDEDPSTCQPDQDITQYLASYSRLLRTVLDPISRSNKGASKSKYDVYHSVLWTKSDKAVPRTNSNWQGFLAAQGKSIGTSLKFVAIDCEFVRCQDYYTLARVTIVDEKCQCLLDTHSKPSQKVTDFVTEVSGVSYIHLKNAPQQEVVLEKIRNILRGKVVIGHTLFKDLSVCGLTKMPGIRAQVDIADWPGFQQRKGKLCALKVLAQDHLGIQIQTGRHSSLEDACATMRLFMSRQKDILKHYKLI